MQLQDIGRKRFDDPRERVVVGVDAERDDPRAPARLRAERARLLIADIARALLEEHEADHGRAGGERGFHGRGVGEAADFDDRRHRRLFRSKRVACQRRGALGSP